MFLTLSNKNYIKDILKSILYNLNYDEMTFISDICCNLIDYIHTKFLNQIKKVSTKFHRPFDDL